MPPYSEMILQSRLEFTSFNAKSKQQNWAVAMLSSLIISVCIWVLCIHHVGALAPRLFGVNYGRVADNLPHPLQVASLIKYEGITKVKIFDADPGILEAFATSGLRMSVAVSNDQISAIASSEDSAWGWFGANIIRFTSQIDTILVGNEVLKYNPDMSPMLVPAMHNLHRVLIALGLHGRIKISTAHAMDVLEPNSSYPPSNGAFKSRHHATMQSMLGFLAETDSFFMVNVYPYFAYREDKGQTISSDYALSGGTSLARDPNTNLLYTNLLDAQLDAVYSAMTKLGHNELRIVVGETGWPSAGGFGANKSNAGIFLRNLLLRALRRAGTPSKPHFPIEVYAFALFNEDLKHNVMEQNFGIFYPNMTKVYPVNFQPYLLT